MTAGTVANGQWTRLRTKSGSCVGRATHFAAGLNRYKLFWVFAFGSVMGFVVESFWCLIKNGCFEVRSSFVFGPFNVIYGIGAAFLYVGLRSNKNSLWKTFLFGAVAGTAVEYICSWVQEMAFGTVSWDYSQLPLNIGGRVCLIYSMFWGALAIFWVKCLRQSWRGLSQKSQTPLANH